VTQATTLGNTLTVDGASTLAGAVTASGGIGTTTINASGTGTFGGLLTANGGVSTTTLNTTGDGTVGGVLRATGGLENTAIGAVTANTGRFTTLAATGNATVAGTLNVTQATTLGNTLTVDGTSTLAGAVTASGGIGTTTINASGTGTFGGLLTASNGLSTNTLTTSGDGTVGGVLRATGGIENTAIGTITPNTGRFTNLVATGTTTLTGLLTANGGVGTTTLTTSGAGVIGGALRVDGATELVGALTVNGTTTLVNTLNADGGLNTPTLEVTGGGSVGGLFEANGGITTATLLASGTMTLQAATGASITPALQFTDLAGDNFIGFRAPNVLTGNRVWTLPGADGDSGNVLSTDGGGNLVWVNPVTAGAAWTLTGNGATSSGGLLGNLPTTGSNFIGTTNNVDLRLVTNNRVRAIVTAAGQLQANNVALTGGSIDGVTIGANSPAAGSFSSLNAQSVIGTSLLALAATDGPMILAAASATGTISLATAGNNRLVVGADGAVAINGAASVGGTLAVTGNATFDGGVEAKGGIVTNTLTASTSLQVTGVTTLTGALTANGGITTTTLGAASLTTTGDGTIGGVLRATGGIEGSAIGATTPSTGRFTTVSSDSITTTGDGLIGGELEVTGITTLQGALSVTGATTLTGLLTANGGLLTDAITTDTLTANDWLVAPELTAPLVTSSASLQLATAGASNFITINTSGVERLRIGGDGRVGIGTGATIGAQLQVNSGLADTIGLIVRGAAGQTASLFEVQDSSGAGQVIVDASGAMSIGTGAAATGGNKLEVNGNVRVTGDVVANNFNQSSDARFKTNIQAITDALSIVRKLQGVSYDWNRAAFPDRGFSPRPQIGVIAQDVERILPELVSTDAQGFKSVNYTGFIPVLIEGMKQQADRLDAQDARLVTAEQTLAMVEERLFKAEEQVIKIDERLGKAEAFVARFELTREPDTMIVLTPTFKVQNLTADRAYIEELRAARIEADKARFKELDADGAVIDNVDAARLRGRVVNTGGKELFVSFGTVAPLFEAAADGHYIVSVTADDGSFATAQVVNAGGVVRVVPTASQGIDVVANGNSVGLVAPSKKVKASWTRTG
jgi:hypothetical protein